jgi:alpha-ketoglutarate-dependent 2,4-dichlorophenoxyacetate dioxygenase
VGSRWYPVDTVTLFHRLRCFAKLAQYVSTRLAWERLDPPLRKRLENSFAWHDYRPFPRQDRARPREPRGARGVAAAMLAHGVEEPGERPHRALHCLAPYAIEGMELAAAQKLFRRPDRRRDRAGA